MDFDTDVRPKVKKKTPHSYKSRARKRDPITYICRQYKVVYAQNVSRFSTGH